MMFLLAGLVIVVAACGRNEEEPIPVEPEEEVVVEPEIEEPEVEIILPERLERENNLTGLPTLSEEAEGKRPVAVMVSNVRANMPQHGISQADLIFEIPIEGGATRLMAVFGDYTAIPTIIPTRSARLYFGAFALGFDAFYAHWSNTPQITETLTNWLGEDRFDGGFNTGGVFGRDQGRINAGFALEHTAYFDGPGFPGAISRLDLRTDLSEEHQGAVFLFNDYLKPVSPEGESITTAHVNFSGTTADFTYDEDTSLFTKDFNGTPHVDGDTGEPLAFTNLLLLETEITVNYFGHNDFNWGGGEMSTGYYVSNGAAQPITWAKDEGRDEGRLRFFDLEGNEIWINRGKTYIAVTHLGGVTFD